jgi:hypothetical protein
MGDLLCSGMRLLGIMKGKGEGRALWARAEWCCGLGTERKAVVRVRTSIVSIDTNP